MAVDTLSDVLAAGGRPDECKIFSWWNGLALESDRDRVS